MYYLMFLIATESMWAGLSRKGFYKKILWTTQVALGRDVAKEQSLEF